MHRLMDIVNRRNYNNNNNNNNVVDRRNYNNNNCEARKLFGSDEIAEFHNCRRLVQERKN